jgi:hypothetical protein
MKNFRKSINNILPCDIELASLLVVGFITHWAALYFIFPGFYDPFWPNHADAYASVAVANTISYWELLNRPRPVGQLISGFVGKAGVRSAIFFFTCLVVINAVYTVFIIRKLIPELYNIKFKKFLIFAAIPYFFTLFTHPGQYIWAAYDGWALLSYLFLLITVNLLILRRGYLFVFGALMAAFLCKETYILSSILLMATWFIFFRESGDNRLLKICGILLFSILLSFYINRVNQSVFISGGNIDSPYLINLHPLSVLSETIRYCNEGVSLQGWLLLLAVMIIGFTNRNKLGSIFVVVSTTIVAGILALVPNSVLPNHHLGGYSWSAAYLLFLPVLYIPALCSGKLEKFWLLIFTMAIVVQPLFLQTRYKSGNWNIEQQRLLKRLQLNIQARLGMIHPESTRAILVTGLTMPFHPFHHGAVLHSFHNLGKTKFYVVSYVSPLISSKDVFATPPESNPVVYVKSEQVINIKFDEVWAFGSDGNIININEKYFHNFLGLDSLYYIFPEAGEILGVFSDSWREPDPYQLLRAGVALIGYNQPELAGKFLTACIGRIPTNPYGYYYQGIAQEMLGNNALANTYFISAINHDDKITPNPAFTSGFNRTQSKAVE